MKNKTRSCICVPKRDGERVRTDLISRGLLDISRKIMSEEDSLIIPILADRYEGYEVTEKDLEPLERTPTDYREIACIPNELKEELPVSFDVIGDVAIVKLSDALLPFRHEIGEALMIANNSVRTVMSDSGVKGDLRIRELEQIAGIGGSETVHKEFGIRIKIDPSKVYFNPRLATERERTASLVKDGETIIDMFAGAAPFGLMISKRARPAVIYSIDLNPDAEGFIRANIEMNNANNLIPITGDAAEEIKKLPDADRIIMNLPQAADKYLNDALAHTKVGGTIHMHKVMERNDKDAFEEKIKEDSAACGFKIKIDRISDLKTYSATMSVFVYDIIRCG